MPLIFLRSRDCYSLSEPLEARERLRKVNKMLASPNFVLTLGALSTSCNKVTGSSSLQTKAAMLWMPSDKNPQHFYSVCTAGSQTLFNKLGASSKRAEARTRKRHRKRAKESKNITQALTIVKIKCDSSNSMTLESKPSCPQETVRIKTHR